MKTKNLMLLMGLLLITGFGSVYAYDANTPYTVTINYIVGQDTSFTVSLAGVETTIDFNPATLNSKNVEPDSQVAGSSTPMVTVTNTGNVNLDFKRGLTSDNPAWVILSMNNANSVDWTKLVNTTSITSSSGIEPASSAYYYFWANFTSAEAGSTPVTFQVNSTASA
jgi:hypothetical protein